MKSFSDEATLASLSCADLFQGYQNRSFTPVEVLEDLRRLVQTDTRNINAFMHVDWDGALQEAQRSAQRHHAGRPLSRLDGVPVSVKDLSDVAGWPTHRGSRALAGTALASDDAPAVQLLRAAGALLFAKTTTTEFGWTIGSYSPLTGTTRNPVDTNRTAGGSSSGAAAHVAAGWGPLALGSDAGGSVRIPASYCGVVGFKPTYGSIPLPPGSAFFDFAHLGPIARFVADCQAAMSVLAAQDTRDPESLFPRLVADPTVAPRIGWCLNLGSPSLVTPETEAALSKVLKQLEDAGFAVQKTDVGIEDTAPFMWDIWAARVFESFHTWPQSKRDELGYGLLALFEAGATMKPEKLAAAQTHMRTLRLKLAAAFSQVDILLTPAAPGPAPLIDAANDERDASNWFSRNGYTFPFNVTGQPALSLPMAPPGQLPIGLQIVGRKYSDAQVLKLGGKVESLLSMGE